MKMNKFFVSTAIDYVNAQPHIGHALEKVEADVLARYHRTLGDEVYFLSGTDENSLKNVRAAEEENMNTKELVDKNSEKFYDLKEALSLSFDDFIRTTEERHVQGAKKLWRACEKDIYKKKYKGLYCVGCEEFYKESELEDGLCPEHKVKPELVEEENYFFKLSKYEDKLKQVIEKDEIKIVPGTRKNEVLSFIEEGLEDICVSRSSERARGWGIEVPDDSSQVMWTWFDALSNYINALGYKEEGKKFQQWWKDNENITHVIGKGILRFHAVYWPAILLSAGISPPKTIFVHGYITVNGEKMSKSLGNVIDPFELVEKHGADPVRYYLLREIPPTKDGDFTLKRFEERYNSDLASGLGNLVSRVLTIAQKIEIEEKPPKELNSEIKKTEKEYKEAIQEFKFNQALESIWKLIGACDKYIQEKKPWELEEGEELNTVLSNVLHGLGSIAHLLFPFMPETSKKITDQLGIDFNQKRPWHFKPSKNKKPLFPRL